MKTKMKYLIIVLISVFSLGCSDDFLDREPLDQVLSTNFYSTEVEAQQALVAVYDVLQYQSVGSWAPTQFISDVLSDDAYGGGADADDGRGSQELNSFNIPTLSGQAHSIWERNYIGIYRANLLLEELVNIDASDAFKTRVTAECKFLRAYFHFNQVRFFENIPLLTSTIKGPSEYAQTQNTPAEVYNQIAIDLVEAAEDLPTVLAGNEIGRLTKWAAEAMIGRVFLFYNGVYGADLDAGGTTINSAKAAEYLDDVITNSGHDLLSNYDSIFSLKNEHSIESVFEIAHGDSPVWWDWDYTVGGEGNLAAQLQGPRVTGSTNWDRGWSFAPVSQKLVNTLFGDPRFDATILQESELDGELSIGYQHTGNFNQKYTSDAEHWGAGGQFELNRTCNYRLIRFADVLLMAAELGSPNAQNHFDRVRARVGLTSLPVTLDNIYRERQLELALEGFRYFDLIRRGTAYASQEINQTGVRGAGYVGDQQLFDVTFNEASKGFLPIPQVEINLSGGIFVQNDGY